MSAASARWCRRNSPDQQGSGVRPSAASRELVATSICGSWWSEGHDSIEGTRGHRQIHGQCDRQRVLAHVELGGLLAVTWVLGWGMKPVTRTVTETR